MYCFHWFNACIRWKCCSLQGVGFFIQKIVSVMEKSWSHQWFRPFSFSYHVYLVRLFYNACFVYCIYLTIHLILFGSICFYESFVGKVPLCRKAVRTLVSARPNSRHYRWSESACFSATRDTMLRQFQDSGARKHKKLNIKCRFVDHERVTSQMIW